MKTVCRVLEVARSHIHDLHRRSDNWKDARKGPHRLVTRSCWPRYASRSPSCPAMGIGVPAPWSIASGSNRTVCGSIPSGSTG